MRNERVEMSPRGLIPTDTDNLWRRSVLMAGGMITPCLMMLYDLISYSALIHVHVTPTSRVLN